MGKCILYRLDTKGIVQKLDSSNRTSKSKARRICNKSLNVASIGEAALVSHMKGKKHTYLMPVTTLNKPVTRGGS